MEFTKVQGAGNDFILVEPQGLERDWPELARAICHRHFGVGGDGLLLVLPSNKADFRMRMFNPDGSEAETCGNGLRCVGRYISGRGRVKARAPEIGVETLAGIRKIRFPETGGRLAEVQVGMGTPNFTPEEIPVDVKPVGGELLDIKSVPGYSMIIEGEELLLHFVAMGNPHAVHFTPPPVADFPLTRIGPEVEKHLIFPQRTNFEVVRVIDRRSLEARVWERGAGETLACGTGACAIGVVARLLGYTGDKVDIRLPGGTLTVAWDGEDEVYLSGPAEIVFTGEWPDQPRTTLEIVRK